ncbi:MFS transporter, partial [Porticoccaceae bacterium]|nr:MFS transporter [Porticoccaceae bacterium]
FAVASKKTCWCFCLMIVAVGAFGITLLKPESNNFIALAVFMFAVNATFAGLWALAPSLLSDIVDYGTLKTGNNCSALYFSLYTFTAKSSGALGGTVALGVVGWFGFDATAASTEHSAQHILGLHFAVGYIPMLCFLLAIVCVVLIPMSKHRHRIIRRRLDARESRLNLTQSFI